MKTTRLIMLLAVALTCCMQNAWASYGSNEIVIKDVSGVIRSVTQVERPAIVEFTLTDAAGMPADGVQIILKGEDGKELYAVSSNGVVVFDEVPAGGWTVSSASPDITFTNILVSSAYVAAGTSIVGTTAAILAGGGAVAGGTVAISYGTRGDPDKTLSPHR